jgi:hypothetical protein
VEQPPGADRRHGGEDQVHVQAPAPRQVLGEDPAEQQADRGAAAGDRAEDPEGGVALLRVGERRGQQRECRGGEECAEDALQGTGGDEDAEGLRGPAEGGGDGEADQADDEGGLAAEEVADAAAEQQQAAEGEGVGGDDPLAVLVREGQGGLGGRQRDVHDRRVEDDHQLSEAEDPEDRPAAGVVGVVRVGGHGSLRCGAGERWE